MAYALDESAMLTAINAALAGPRGANPLVGAVITDVAGEIVASGYHRGAGTFHAERAAIADAYDAGITDLSQHTLYTSLEPCTQKGRQPACTRVIAESGLRRVITAAADPTKNGGGAQVLSDSGLEVHSGVLKAHAEELNHRWNRAAYENRPFVTAHLAQSIDARIAAHDGTSQWITSRESREHTHKIRQRVDAIMVGTSTVRIDDPRLTARPAEAAEALRQPLRCVMGLRDTPDDALLRQGKPEGDGWIQLRTRDPLEALQRLHVTQHLGHPIKHVLIEGGQSVLSAFIAADLVDELFVYSAPLLLGSGTSSLGGIGVNTLTDAKKLELDESDGGAITRMESDVCLHMAPAVPRKD